VTSKAELMKLRRELISTLKNIEDVLKLPPDKRSLKTRVDKGRTNKVRYIRTE